MNYEFLIFLWKTPQYFDKFIMKNTLLLLFIFCKTLVNAQVQSPDNGDGTYTNPIIHADYSDPDVVRVREDYYMVASSFNCIPALPILHSKDLVNWTLINHALKKQPPFDFHNTARHGGGVWAPAIRFHKDAFYIYYPDPDFGIYMVKTKDPKSPWSEPILVQGGKGLIDPCPFWDDDGKAYLAYAYAGSRAGIKSILTIREMNTEGSKLIADAVLLFDGHDGHPTVEGPKIYKKDGFYYIFAPAGGVATGWQLVLKSKNIYGPYASKIVLAQGNTAINGPHQGAWVDTPSGEDWFIHFQDKGPYGRVVHLQPMTWRNGFPVIGNDADGDGTGTPVFIHKKPNVLAPMPKTAAIGVVKKVENYAFKFDTGSDEFTQPFLNKYWQWQANPLAEWGFGYPSKGVYRLNAMPFPDTNATKNLRDLPSILLQKFPAEQFKTTTKLTFTPNTEGDKIALIVWGHDYSYLNVVKKTDGLWLNQALCADAHKGGIETNKDLVKLDSSTIWLQVIVEKGGMCTFAYSLDGTEFKYVGDSFKAKQGHWIGAKVGLFCFRSVVKVNDAGFADIDFFRME
jgi:beta-xylosidase